MQEAIIIMDHSTSAIVGHSKQDIFKLIDKCEQSNMTIKAFCDAHHIAIANFYYWRKKYRSENAVSTTADNGFSLLQLNKSASNMMPCLFAEVNGIRIYQPVPAGYLKELLS